jgi:hypothetical protein
MFFSVLGRLWSALEKFFSALGRLWSALEMFFSALEMFFSVLKMFFSALGRLWSARSSKEGAPEIPERPLFLVDGQKVSRSIAKHFA